MEGVGRRVANPTGCGPGKAQPAQACVRRRANDCARLGQLGSHFADRHDTDGAQAPRCKTCAAATSGGLLERTGRGRGELVFEDAEAPLGAHARCGLRGVNGLDLAAYGIRLQARGTVGSRPRVPVPRRLAARLATRSKSGALPGLSGLMIKLEPAAKLWGTRNNTATCNDNGKAVVNSRHAYTPVRP